MKKIRTIKEMIRRIEEGETVWEEIKQIIADINRQMGEEEIGKLRYAKEVKSILKDKYLMYPKNGKNIKMPARFRLGSKCSSSIY